MCFLSLSLSLSLFHNAVRYFTRYRVPLRYRAQRLSAPDNFVSQFSRRVIAIMDALNLIDYLTETWLQLTSRTVRKRSRVKRRGGRS